MKYRYGSFFGVTAIHLMYMREADIEDIFKLTHIKASSLILLENLYTEVEALKSIFAPKGTPGLPHVVMRRDNQNPAVKNIVNGFNYYLSVRDSGNIESEVDTSLDLDNFDALDDLSNLNLEGAETSFFSDSEPNEETMQDYNKSAKDSLDYLFGDEDETVDLDSLDLSGLDTGSMTVDVSRILENLTEAGEKYSTEVKTVSNILRLQTYLAAHKDDFTTEEYESISSQIANLPKEPVTVEVPSQFREHTEGISDKSMKILNSLYTHMMRPAVLHGNKLGMTFVDYVSDKLKLILSSKIDSVKRLFFAAKSDFSRDMSENQINNFILDLNNVYLGQEHVSIVLSNVSALLMDCDETLGLKNDAKEQIQLQQIRSKIQEYYNYLDKFSDTELFAEEEAIASSLVDMLSLHFTSASREHNVKMFFRDLLRSEKLLPLLGNLDNLRIVLKIDDALQNVVISEFYGKLNAEMLNDDNIPAYDQIVSICTPIFIKFTKETGILGFTCDYSSKLKHTLNEIVTPLEAKVDTVFDKNSENYRMSHLLRKHLKSLQKRLEKYDRR